MNALETRAGTCQHDPLLAQLHRSRRKHPVALSLNGGILTDRLRALEIAIYVFAELRWSFPQLALKAFRLLSAQRTHDFGAPSELTATVPSRIASPPR